jgi:hypothetical protein
MSLAESLAQQLEFARGFTLPFLSELHPDDWFRMPMEGVTHIAWQVGHIAVSQAGLICGRVGSEPPENWPYPADWGPLFGRGSTPEADVARYPSASDLRQVFDRVFEKSLARLRETADSVFNEPVNPPHRAFHDKFGAARFAAYHEFVHAGQIALLRRLLGYRPLR